MRRLILVVVLLFFASRANAEPRLLWGDTHLHTSNSFDAFLNRNMTAETREASSIQERAYTSPIHYRP